VSDRRTQAFERPSVPQRPPWLLAVLVCLILPLLVPGLCLHLWFTGLGAEPVAVSLSGSSVQAMDKVQVLFLTPDHQLKHMNRVEYTFYWSLERTWVMELILQVPRQDLTKLQQVEVILGPQVFSFSGEQVQQWPRDPSAKFYSEIEWLIVPNFLEKKSSFPGLPNPPWNWPGDGQFLSVLWKHFFPGLLFLTLLVFWLISARTASGRSWVRQFVGGENNLVMPAPIQGEKRWWDWLTLLLLGVAVAFLEWRDPFYFTQDDNMVDCLPVILVGCRGLWEGHFPNYNPYLFLGSPLANLGTYALTYPPLYLAYALARHVLLNEHATLEVFAILHILAGFLAMRYLARKLALERRTANLVGLSFVLSGSILIVGRCWFNFLPLVVWLPLVFVGLVNLRQGPVSWRWVLGMGMATGLPFHVGFPQAAIYLNGFFCLAVVYWLMTGELTGRRALCCLPGLFLGAGLALPLVYQQWLLAVGTHRTSVPGQGIVRELAAFFLPYPLVQAEAPTTWGNLHRETMGHLYFAGGLLAFLFACQVVGLTLQRPGKKHLGGLVWSFCALVSLWLSLGEAGGLWTLLTQLPGIGFLQRFPMRVLPFATFFLCLSGGLVLDRLLRRLTDGKKNLLISMTLGLLVWHVLNCRASFYSFASEPYPPLPEDVRQIFRDQDGPTGRIFSWAPIRSYHPDYPLWMSNNLPAAYQLPAFGGYSSLLESHPLVDKMYLTLEQNRQAALQAYGVRWHVFPPDNQAPRVTSVRNSSWWQEVLTPNDVLLRRLRPDRFSAIPAGQHMMVTEYSPVHPLAFPSNKHPVSLPVRLHAGGIDVDISRLQEDKSVVVNFLHYPEMAAAVDGREVACLPDFWNRMVVPLPTPGKLLSVRYVPSWGKGCLLGMGLIGAGVGLWIVLQRRQKDRG
jgi:hypothetical protein